MKHRDKVYDIYEMTARPKGDNLKKTPPAHLRKLTLEKAKEECYPIHLITFEKRNAISYDPISNKIGGLFAISLMSAAAELGFRAHNIIGLGPNNTGFARVKQIWQFNPEPSQKKCEELKKSIEKILKAKIKEVFSK